MSARTRWDRDGDRDAVAEHIKKIVDTFPPLTDEQRAVLAAVFGTPPPPSREDTQRADAA